MHLFLKAGERLYLNSALLRVDRKVNIELLNDVTFLLEAHVLRDDEATTPLRQLYYVVQTMMINASAEAEAKSLFGSMLLSMLAEYSNLDIRSGLKKVHEKVLVGRLFDALKLIRDMYSIEEQIFAADGALPAMKRQMR